MKVSLLVERTVEHKLIRNKNLSLVTSFTQIHIMHCALLFVLATALGCGSGGDDSQSLGEQFGITGGFEGNTSGNTANDQSDSGDATDESTGADGESGADGATGTDSEAGGASSDDGGSSFDGILGFPSDELFIQIIGPSADSIVTSGGGITYLAGILFGTADTISWTSTTGSSGVAEGNRFWSTGPVTLSPGNNTITVTAERDGEVSTDTITVTYNPGFYFDAKPVARPGSFFTGPDVDIAVTLDVPNGSVSLVTLFEVDEDGNTLGQIGQMLDNGNTVLNCDEIQNDGVYSYCLSLGSPTPTTRYLRAQLQVTLVDNTITVFSAPTPIEIDDPLTAAECEQMLQVNQDAHTQFITSNDTTGTVANLKANPLVADAGANNDGYGIWIQYQNGVLGALNLSPPGMRGGESNDAGHSAFGSAAGALTGNVVDIESKRVTALAPFNSEFGPLDEVPQIAAALSGVSCPEFDMNGPLLNGAATVAQFRRAYDSGVFAYSGHADTYFTTMATETKAGYGWEHDGSQEILWSGQAVNCQDLTQTNSVCTSSAECGGTAECALTSTSGGSAVGVCVDRLQHDLRRGRVVLGDATWGVHPELFVRHSARTWPSSLVYLGACRTLSTGTLAGALFAVGAKAIAGYTNYISSDFAAEQGRMWFENMMTNNALSGEATLFPVPDPANVGAFFGLFGGSNISISDATILTADFEKGETTGWTVDGDGRVISQLGITIPVTGKFMGILSTGLGYTQQTGELNQSFCIPPTATDIAFYWKFFSEEFLEWCGSEYQDTFQATLETPTGQLTLVDVKVDDLCPATECVGCGAQAVSLIPSDVSFDQGGVYNTQWQRFTTNVSNLAGAGPVTLRLFATDQGDSVYDTVILVDSITFE